MKISVITCDNDYSNNVVGIVEKYMYCTKFRRGSNGNQQLRHSYRIRRTLVSESDIKKPCRGNKSS